MKCNFRRKVFFLILTTLILFTRCEAQKVEWLDTGGSPINAHAGGVLFSNGMYYWYGEYRSPKPKKDNIHWDSNQKVTMYKSDDLKKWKFVKIVLDVSGNPKDYDLERPKIIYNKKNKQYVMWFHLEEHRKYKEGYAGVAVSNEITGPYKVIKILRPNGNIKPIISNTALSNDDWFVVKANKSFASYYKIGQQVRDLTLFVDDDEHAYLIYETEDDYSLQVAELNEDYTAFNGKYSRVLVGMQNEAPAVFKKDGLYYLITSGLTGYKPNAARVSISSNIFGPWTTIGNLVSSENVQDKNTTFNTQPSFVLKNKDGGYIYIGDEWDISNGGFQNLWKSTYLWLPIKFHHNLAIISKDNH